MDKFESIEKELIEQAFKEYLKMITRTITKHPALAPNAEKIHDTIRTIMLKINQ